MLLCRGKKCLWKKVCSRYVLGTAAKNLPQNPDDQWIGHCLHASKFHRMNGVQDSLCPPSKMTGI